MCGEQHGGGSPGKAGRGSPPRVRGTGPAGGPAQRRVRITPACAGNSPAAGRQALTEEDHPRVCGEQSIGQHQNRLFLGSPPRVRGTEGFHACIRPLDGITPACAGNRQKRTWPGRKTKDHPRVCAGTGSPSFQKTIPSRITPACAGNRLSLHLKSSIYQDHPRVCGEQYVPKSQVSDRKGSPPRVRGTERVPYLQRHADGITPACAGNRLAVPLKCRRCPDHPRVCGEQMVTPGVMVTA